ncbi:hypothetical protein EQG49_05685 [Periweissella cryptocerci]|uniref:Lipoprotein n=1 Tax=Periweissella cryptocerci TaxID=2506420 RepID=A0A4P6YTH7_9LACO|nr:hypothetical protein [Periweissella cryptocerci]QBO35986.1 hypothetical protein EQG49_05685 [Periweissella cryptocerci]
MKKEHTRKFATLAIILISTIMLTGCGAKAVLGGDSGSVATSQSKDATTDATSKKVSEYEGILQAARNLTADNKFEESNKTLNAMSVTELAKPELAAVKDASDEVRQQNTDGVAATKKAKAAKRKAKAASKKNATNTGTTSNTTSSQTGFSQFPEFTGTYYFINGGNSRPQATLNIDTQGNVTQTNNDRAPYTGNATISANGTSQLSYDVSAIDYGDEYYPTKSITADVAITVTWNKGGGTQTYYGYTSYNGTKVLTDGRGYSSGGVNEVWES